MHRTLIDPRTGKPVRENILIHQRMPTRRELRLLEEAAPEVEMIRASLGMKRMESNMLRFWSQLRGVGKITR
jgi:hypothetical protein